MLQHVYDLTGIVCKDNNQIICCLLAFYKGFHNSYCFMLCFMIEKAFGKAMTQKGKMYNYIPLIWDKGFSSAYQCSSCHLLQDFSGCENKKDSLHYSHGLVISMLGKIHNEDQC